MDEREVVPRREAVVGLSLLGIFSLLLTATLAYRIVYPTKRVAPTFVINEWKSQGPLPEDPNELFAPAKSTSQLAAEESPTVDLIPTIMEESPNFPASAVSEMQLAPQAEVPATVEGSPPVPAPSFVAPSYR